MLQIQNIHLTFSPNTPLETKALRGASLYIKPGEFVSVIGSNGAGKSSLLNVVAGDTFVDQGRILIDQKDVTRLPSWRRAKDVARVFQDPMAGTCEDLTVEENLSFAYRRGQGRGLKVATDQRLRTLFQDRLALLGLGLEKRLKDRIGLLSGGQRQAVSLLMATLRPSKVLLLDEHTAALDPRIAAFILELTNTLVREQQLTTMMVTHSMQQALEYGDRTVMLHQGQVIFDVSGEERQRMTVADLLAMFQQQQQTALADDALLLT